MQQCVLLVDMPISKTKILLIVNLCPDSTCHPPTGAASRGSTPAGGSVESCYDMCHVVSCRVMSCRVVSCLVLSLAVADGDQVPETLGMTLPIMQGTMAAQQAGSAGWVRAKFDHCNRGD